MHKHISLTVETSDDELTINLNDRVMLLVDEKKIVRVIANLLSNAIKFTPEGGSVRVVSSVIKSHISDKKLSFRISVIDTGAGLSKVSHMLMTL